VVARELLRLLQLLGSRLLASRPVTEPSPFAAVE